MTSQIKTLYEMIGKIHITKELRQGSCLALNTVSLSVKNMGIQIPDHYM